MKYIQLTLVAILVVLCAGCFQVTDLEDEKTGHLGENIYLKGPDTLTVFMGSIQNSDVAWLDGSSRPCKFEIINARDANGQKADKFFENFKYQAWRLPYIFNEDTTLAQITSKIHEANEPCISINEVNGEIQFKNTTKYLQDYANRVFSLDVKVSNSAGEKIIKDYAKLKMSANYKPFVVNEMIVGLALIDENGSYQWILYDQINSTNPDFAERSNNIYEDNGKEKWVRIKKMDDNPVSGVHIILSFLDADGKVINSSLYKSYNKLKCYFHISVGRENKEDGAHFEFPMTPWPPMYDWMSYITAKTIRIDKELNVDALKRDFQAVPRVVPGLFSGPWPSDNWATKNTGVTRMRSKININEPGTWLIQMKFPYIHTNGNWNAEQQYY